MAGNYTLGIRIPAGSVQTSEGDQSNSEATLQVRVLTPGVTAPEPISSLGLEASAGTRSVRLSWNLPSDNGGSAIVRYEYRYAAVGAGLGPWKSVGAEELGVRVGNLAGGREHVFEVRAVNGLGKGPIETVMATPLAGGGFGGGGGGGGGGLLFPPDAPATLTALPGDGAVRLEWSPPENDGGSPIMRYEYRLRDGREEFGEWTPIPNSAPEEVNASAYTVMELGNGTVYTFELRAVNAAGRGQESEAVEVVMPLDPAYWSNFRAEDLQGEQLSLEAFLSGGSGDRELRFVEGLRFEEDALNGQGEVTTTRMGSYGYGYTSRRTGELRLDYTYTSRDEPEQRSGTASEVLPAGTQVIETDALGYLRGLGVPIPETGNQLGTLRVEAPLGSEMEAVVRTTTMVPDGRAGLAYPGVAEEEGFTEAVYLCGLRQNEQDRSNVAFQNMGTSEDGAITIRTTVYSGEAGDSEARELDDVRLEPGGFHQYSGLLGRVENGYVKVERVEGEAPFYAYGVINDQANSDGSFVFPVTGSSLEGKMGQTLPVIVETTEFTSELTVTNFSEGPRTLEFEFVSEQIKGDERVVIFGMELEAGEQVIVPELVEELRREEMAKLGTSRGFYLGPLFVQAEDGDMSGIVIGARTGSEGGGGSYSVFYNAVPAGEAFSREAWVMGLQQNEENRSNLALVNTGEVDGSASVFRLEIYNGETGMLEETVVTKPIPARGWHQVDGILLRSDPDTRQGYVRIEKVSGENPFLAYGVVNDGGAPGERSGDGAYLPARE